MAPPSMENAQRRGHVLNEALGTIALDGLYDRDAGHDSPATSTTTTVSPLYYGIGSGLGVLLFGLIALVVLCIIRKRSKHRRAIAELDENEARADAREEEVTQISRPMSMARRSRLLPLQAQAGGWDALGSNEAIHEPAAAVKSGKRRRGSMSVSKRLKSHGIQLKHLKHLSAILESPRSGNTKSPSPSALANGASISSPIPAMPAISADSSIRRVFSTNNQNLDGSASIEVARSDSPRPEALPTIAIISFESQCVPIASDNVLPRAIRSISTSALKAPTYESSMSDGTSQVARPRMHARSISLGAPSTRPPSGPVPPLPVIAPHAEETDSTTRHGVCVSRMSSSSLDSASSSVLVTSPVLKMRDSQNPSNSPTLEEVVADDENASLKAVLNRQWQDPRVIGPRPDANHPAMTLDRSRTSTHGNVVRFVSDNALLGRDSSDSLDSFYDDENEDPIPEITTASCMGISRISPISSLDHPLDESESESKVITTPTRNRSRRPSVSANGSPAERKRNKALRVISGNANAGSNWEAVSRQASESTLESGRSSNGNPFQWDCGPQASAKPSALKGSPNARRGHRRQNCVRISTLTPQVLGPLQARPTSPTAMHGIEEEMESEVHQVPRGGLTPKIPTTKRSLSRPLSTCSSSSLHKQALRTSLTLASPTLSAWATYQEKYLPSLPSDTMLSTPGKSSDRSSGNFTIPLFPVPGKATISPVLQSHTVPEFCLSRASTTDRDSERSSSPFPLHMSSDGPTGDLALPSSPPLLAENTKEYDPAWPRVDLPAREMLEEYDPTSPPWDLADPDRRAPIFFPFAFRQAGHGDGGMSHRSRPMSCAARAAEGRPDSEPCSPKTMPEELDQGYTLRATQKLTSENASAIMARITSGSDADLSTVHFPGSNVPIFPPPHSAADVDLTYPAAPSPKPSPPPRSVRRLGSVSTTMAPRLSHSPPPPPPLPTIPQSSSPPSSTIGSFTSSPRMPSPLHIPVLPVGDRPLGPRSAPAPSVLKNAMALRRMNSEIVCGPTNRESQRYVRMGREPSPLLPWVGYLDPSESCNSLFDFDFDTGPGASAERREDAESGSVMDEIDLSVVDRKLPGGLAGFDTDAPHVWKTWGNGPAASAAAEKEQNGTRSAWELMKQSWDAATPAQTRKPAAAATTGWTPHFSFNGGFDGLVTPTQEISDSKTKSSLKAPTPSETPRSLYDADGFLKA